MGLRKISPAFAKNEIVKVQCNNSPTSTEIPDFANQLTISRADEGTRAWRLESAATVPNTGGFRGHSEHGAGRSMDGLDQDDPATGRGFSSTLDFRL
jgi:hypothetical protein